MAGALCSIAFAGCGLGDYEENLAREQGRLARLEEEQSRLTHELSLPKEKDDDIPYDPSKPVARPFPTPFFYRPPIGIASEQGTVVVPRLVYAYPVVKNAPFQTNTLQRLEVAASDSMSQSEFAADICPRFGLLQPANNFTPITVQCPERGERTFQRVTFATVGGGANYLYLYDDPNTHIQVALCYESAKPLGQDVVDRIEYSLRTLAVGNEANMLANQSRLTPHR